MNPTPQATLTRRLLLALTCTMAMAPSAWSQTTAEADAAKAAADAKAANVPVTNTPGKADDKLVLSPFIVTTEKDSGYYAENTLMGSRLNSKISRPRRLDHRGDEAAARGHRRARYQRRVPLRVQHRGCLHLHPGRAQPLQPHRQTSAVTPVTTAPPSVSRPPTASAASAAWTRRQNNYPTIARLAFDAYNSNSVEISRGPNSMLFGTGAPAGIINQSSAAAVLGQQKTQVQLRGGSFDAWRVSMNTNIPIGDKLAIFVAGPLRFPAASSASPRPTSTAANTARSPTSRSRRRSSRRALSTTTTTTTARTSCPRRIASLPGARPAAPGFNPTNPGVHLPGLRPRDRPLPHHLA